MYNAYGTPTYGYGVPMMPYMMPMRTPSIAGVVTTPGKPSFPI